MVKKKMTAFEMAVFERYQIVKKRGYSGTFTQWKKYVGLK